MIKVVAGSFRMAPCEALLEITCMLPMHHFLSKLTHTSALHLYRLPWASQLLHHLGPEWYAPHQGDHPLVVPLPPVPGWGTLRPTALETLTAWVPSDGPRVDVTVSAPWEVPNWGAQLVCMGKDHAWMRKEWVRTLTDFVLRSSYEVVHIAGHVH